MKALGVKSICIESKQMSTVISLKVNKTDRNDAHLIAEVMSCNFYSEVYPKTRESIDLGIQIGARRTLINIRTKLKNSIRGFLKGYGIRLGTVSNKSFSETVRKILDTCEIAVQSTINSLLNSYDEICNNIDQIDETIALISKKDPVVELLESVQGVGTITAMTFMSVIDDPFRFEDPRNVRAFLGLTPNQYASDDSVKQGRISKCGSAESRTLLVECG